VEIMKQMTILLALFMAFVVTSEGASIGATDHSVCFADYLIENGVIAPHEDLGTGESPTEYCKAVIQLTKIMSVDKLVENLSENAIFKEHVDCMREPIKQTNIGDLLLASHVYIVATNTTENDFADESEAIKSQITQLVVEIYVTCSADSVFGPLFDQYLEGNDATEGLEGDALIVDYCVRKHVIGNGMLEGLNPNPKDVDASDVNCYEIVDEVIKNEEDNFVNDIVNEPSPETGEVMEMEPEKIECIKSAIHDSNVVGNMLPFGYLKELELTDDDKSGFRKQFVANLAQVSDSMAICN